MEKIATLSTIRRYGVWMTDFRRVDPSAALQWCIKAPDSLRKLVGAAASHLAPDTSGELQ